MSFRTSTSSIPLTSASIGSSRPSWTPCKGSFSNAPSRPSSMPVIHKTLRFKRKKKKQKFCLLYNTGKTISGFVVCMRFECLFVAAERLLRVWLTLTLRLMLARMHFWNSDCWNILWHWRMIILHMELFYCVDLKVKVKRCLNVHMYSRKWCNSNVSSTLV